MSRSSKQLRVLVEFVMVMTNNAYSIKDLEGVIKLFNEIHEPSCKINIIKMKIEEL